MVCEKIEQTIFCRYCEMRGISFIHVPNEFPLGGLRNKYAYINMLKSIGYKKGFPDLIVFAKNKKHKLLFLEFKKEKGGIVSKDQKDWIDWLNKNGYFARVVKGNEDAINVLEKYLQNID